jgi:hypothetical protein
LPPSSEKDVQIDANSGDVRPDHPNQDGSAIEWLLIEKLAAPILELADGGHAQGTAAAAGKILAPLM